MLRGDPRGGRTAQGRVLAPDYLWILIGLQLGLALGWAVSRFDAAARHLIGQEALDSRVEGRAEQDDGALLLIAKNDRKMRIEVGYGLEPVLSDVMSRRVLDQVLRLLVVWRRRVFERRRELRRRRLVEQLVGPRWQVLGVALQAAVPVDPVGPGLWDRGRRVDAKRDDGQPLGP
ncbi:MAG: TPM domain-containing protein, partial [Deltaproteobacteria bacterium]|nr:TPM domain-containing protein [Deltaproteobacteria bacterium]